MARGKESLLACLAPQLKEMALFAVNTGCRDQEISQLRWCWEIKVPMTEIGSVFIIPGIYTKNEKDRLVVLNQVAQEVIERQRDQHDEFVFVYHGGRIGRMFNSGWMSARQRAGLAGVRVHDLKHTFGRRLRSAGVSFEDRQDLLGHKSSRITTHYSSAELLNLWKAANTVCDREQNQTLTLLKWERGLGLGHEKVTNSTFDQVRKTL